MAAEAKDKSSAKEPAQDVQQPAATAAAQGGDTEEWVFTIVSSTGEIAKVEKLDQASGQRSELSQEEYAALCGYIDPSAAYGYGEDPSAAHHQTAGYEGSQFDAGFDASGMGGSDVYTAGYYQALQDYEAALAQQAALAQHYEAAAMAYGAGGFGYSAEENAAYLQGMADYEALLG